MEEGSISASYISTNDQLADILIKSLGRVKFHKGMDTRVRGTIDK
jgi:DNA-binding CsgD family transcriptional regulator